MKEIGVGIIGLGTIGCGTVSVLQRNEDIITSRVGVPLRVVRAADIDLARKRPVELPKSVLTNDAREVIRDPKVQVVVELIGGQEPARTFILEAMENGKHVVTANKALLSVSWAEIVAKAEEKGVTLGFEGSVAGGIPLIRAIRSGLVANRIQSVTGIINGTCNYILSRMHKERKAFGEILADAQARGYAEADPAMDVEGIDAAQKLSILVNLCFGCAVSYRDIPHEGIVRLSPMDLEMADEFGYRVKLLASASLRGGEVEAWVNPALVPEGHPLATVDGVFNAVFIVDDNLGPSLYYGRGAGDLPTGSAVVSDLVSCARDILSGARGRMPAGSRRRTAAAAPPPVPLARDASSEFYVRISAEDRPGVLSTVSGVLARNGISISSVIQRGRGTFEGEGVPLVMTTHEAKASRVRAAAAELDALDVVRGAPFVMRILPEGER